MVTTATFDTRTFADELRDLADEIAHGDLDQTELAAAMLRLRTYADQGTRECLTVNAAVPPMLARLRELAPLRKQAEDARAAAAADVDRAQAILTERIEAERKILAERTSLICGAYRLHAPVTHLANAADIARARVYRIVSDQGSHPDTCRCRQD